MFSKRQNPESISKPIHIYFSFGDSEHSGCTWSKIQKKTDRTGHSFCGPGIIRCVLLHVMSRLEFSATSCVLHTGAYTCFCVIIVAQRKKLLSFRDERTVLFQLLPIHLTPSTEHIPQMLVKLQ